MKEEIINEIYEETKIGKDKIKATVKLLNEGNSVPFIARYRKEITKNLDDESIRRIESSLKRVFNLIERKEEIINLLKEGGNYTKELEEEIKAAKKLINLEDIYAPFKGKRKTRASEAKRKGLLELSKKIFKQEKDILQIEKEAEKFLNDEVLNVKDAISGAMDIIAEEISNDISLKEDLRKEYLNSGIIVSKKKDDVIDERKVYENYYDFSENLKTIPAHRILAIFRGEKEKILSVKIDIEEENILKKIEFKIIKKESKIKELMENIIKDSYKRLIYPSLEREFRNILKERADEKSINIFKSNLKQVLLTPPLKGKNILGIDPGYKTGCKIAAIDKNGMFLESGVIYNTPPQNDIEGSMEKILQIIDRWDIDIIAIGNGTASRETEEFVSSIIKKRKKLEYIVVSEAGASVYSASKIAREEFPNLDVSIRGAISIARRINDPMAEIVKIDPKSIGVGQYQHDVDQKKLKEGLENVIEDIVNKVGVDLNSASISLLSYISGLTKKTASNIVKFRDEKGSFKNREEILNISGIGENTFKQAVGFLRIYNSKNILDKTGIHPESYNILEDIINFLGFNLKDLEDINLRKKIINEMEIKKEEIIKKFEIGKIDLKDIIYELKKPGRDIREELGEVILRKDTLNFEDLKIGETIKGKVRSIVAFGAFVDIGIKENGLLHISKISKKYIKDPLDVLSVGDIVNVKIIDKDEKTKRISLSMILDE